MSKPLTRDYALAEGLKEQLQQLAPEAFEDGQLNVDTLRDLLESEETTDDQAEEHFGLNWVGKRQARRIAAQLYTGTLKPCSGEGVNEDQTENIFIEGENLEVLKVLHKSYAGRVKMINIDPPYNTGNDFIYKDNFADSTEEYLRKSKQKTNEGLLVSNPKSSGRFHANWLSFMYPRLRVAKGLLRDDGVIFISIDESELNNLCLLMNEVFGEENYVGSFIWKRNKSGTQNAQYFSTVHETVVVYTKGETTVRWSEPYSAEDMKDYKLEDDIGKFYWKPTYHSTLGRDVILDGDVLVKKTTWSKRKIEDAIENGEAELRTKEGKHIIYAKQRPSNGKLPYSLLGTDKIPMYEKATREVADLLDISISQAKSVTPKPKELIKYLLTIINDKDALVLDFFAGSCTTAHAVMSLNQEDNGKRRFICVQIPESCLLNSESSDKCYETIAEIGKERIRRVIKQRGSSNLGFRVFKLDTTSIRRWKDMEPKHGVHVELEAQMEIHFKAPLVDDVQPQNFVTEVLLLQGFPLTAQQEPITDDITRVTHPDVPFTLYVSWAKRLPESFLETLPLQATDHFVCLDLAFGNNNSFKQTISNHCHLQTI